MTRPVLALHFVYDAMPEGSKVLISKVVDDIDSSPTAKVRFEGPGWVELRGPWIADVGRALVAVLLEGTLYLVDVPTPNYKASGYSRVWVKLPEE